jgi:hypothetical protein
MAQAVETARLTFVARHARNGRAVSCGIEVAPDSRKPGYAISE